MKMYSKIKNTMDEGGLPLLFRKILRRLRISYLYFFIPAHQMPRGLPFVRVEMKKLAATEKDILIAKRILTSFHKASLDEKKYAKPDIHDIDMWDDIKKKYHNDFFHILASNDARRVADYLCNMHLHGLTYGISGSLIEYNHMISNTRLRNQKGVIVKDIIASFAEAIGVLPYETIVPYVEKKNIYVDSDLLVDKIEKKIGINITPPEIDGGLFKLRLKKGFFDIRDLWSLYAAWRISNLVDKGSSICEIGAGVGKVAMYANRFGFLDYSIFDLPLLNIVQAWHIIKSLPDKKILLYGETSESKNSIKIMPYWEFIKTTNQYTLVLNQDSFPEISKRIVEDYLHKIKKCAKCFLSINQENEAPLLEGTDKRNLIVPNLIEALGGFKRIYRFPFWLRKGYVEEFYKIIDTPLI